MRGFQISDFRFQIGKEIELQRETDGRWIAEVPSIPGSMIYDRSQQDAVERLNSLATAILRQRAVEGTNLKSEI